MLLVGLRIGYRLVHLCSCFFDYPSTSVPGSQAPERIRTSGQLLRRQLLWPLSYKGGSCYVVHLHLTMPISQKSRAPQIALAGLRELVVRGVLEPMRAAPPCMNRWLGDTSSAFVPSQTLAGFMSSGREIF